jgi:hypothetical protein
MLILRRQKVWKLGLTVERRREIVVAKLEEKNWLLGDGNKLRDGLFCVYNYEPVNGG